VLVLCLASVADSDLTLSQHGSREPKPPPPRHRRATAACSECDSGKREKSGWSATRGRPCGRVQSAALLPLAHQPADAAYHFNWGSTRPKGSRIFALAETRPTTTPTARAPAPGLSSPLPTSVGVGSPHSTCARGRQGLTYEEPRRRPAGGIPRHQAVLRRGRGRRHLATCVCARVGRALGTRASYLGCGNRMKAAFLFWPRF
jgi:hypothetical protein